MCNILTYLRVNYSLLEFVYMSDVNIDESGGNMMLAFIVVILIPLTLGIWLLNLAVYVLYSGTGLYFTFCVFS